MRRFSPACLTMHETGDTRDRMAGRRQPPGERMILMGISTDPQGGMRPRVPAGADNPILMSKITVPAPAWLGGGASAS